MTEPELDQREVIERLNAAQTLPDFTPPCPLCGSDESKVVLRNRPVVVDGREFIAENDEATQCTGCGHQFYTPRQAAVARRCMDVMKEIAAKIAAEDAGTTDSSTSDDVGKQEVPEMSEASIKEVESNLIRSDQTRSGPTAGPHAAAFHLTRMKERITDPLQPLREAERIVADKAGEIDPAREFLDRYEPGDNPITRIMAWDHRVIVCGHSANKAACVAITTAVQTAAAIGRSLKSVDRVQRYTTEKGEPVYDIQLTHGKRARRVVAGLLSSFAGIARTSEGDAAGSIMTLADQRRIPIAD